MTLNPGILNKIVIALADEAALPFIFNSYLKSQEKYIPCIESSRYFKRFHRRIELFIENGGSLIVVKDKNDDNSIMAWMGFSTSPDDKDASLVRVSILYVYVKNVYRRLGICTALLQMLKDQIEQGVEGRRVVFDVNILTQNMKTLRDRFNITYDPTLIERLMDENKSR
jgi:hypothetical protein